MKWEPLVAMVALVFVGMWLVLQPALSREGADIEMRIGAERLRVNQEISGIISIGAEGDPMPETPRGRYTFVEPRELAERGELTAAEFDWVIAERKASWGSRPPVERALLGFFNISSWGKLAWVAIGLTGQMAFFGRMFMQWVVSEKRRESQVPELFWWFSLIGGVCLFTYFVWRVDVVGVLGQSAGVVIYGRNLRLIYKHKSRARREAARDQAGDGATGEGDPVISVPGAPPETDGAGGRRSENGGPDAGANRT